MIALARQAKISSPAMHSYRASAANGVIGRTFLRPRARRSALRRRACNGHGAVKMYTPTHNAPLFPPPHTHTHEQGRRVRKSPARCVLQNHSVEHAESFCRLVLQNHKTCVLQNDSVEHAELFCRLVLQNHNTVTCTWGAVCTNPTVGVVPQRYQGPKKLDPLPLKNCFEFFLCVRAVVPARQKHDFARGNALQRCS